MHSCLYQGRVRHRRHAPRTHAFTYRVVYAYLDLDELDTVFSGRWLWSTRHPAPVRFKRSDYLGDNRLPLKQSVQDRVEQATGRRPRGPIRLLTHLRYFGFCFNPVSFYYCLDAAGNKVETIVAEITNTPWGERYSYVLAVDQARSTTRHLQFRMRKDFHVSPFMPMDMDYQWNFSAPTDRLNVHMINRLSGDRQFDATLSLERRSIGAKSCALALVAHPVMSLKVISAIYWQALRLYLKGIPFYPHPDTRNSDRAGGADAAKSP